MFCHQARTANLGWREGEGEVEGAGWREVEGATGREQRRVTGNA